MTPTRRAIVLALLALPSWSGAVERLRLDLSGTWEYVRCDSLDDPLPQTGWAPLQVPQIIPGFRGGGAWFRRSLEVPAEWRGRRLILRFGGVKWSSRVLVNGTLVGGCFNGHDLFEVDATKAVRFGQANELLVGARDWTGVFDPEAPPFEWRENVEVRALPVDRVLAPIGGVVTSFGIWAKPELLVCAPLRVADLTVVTSVRQRRLTVTVALDNPGPAAGVTLRAAVHERGGDRVLELPAERAEVPAGGTALVRLAADWPEPHLWSHEDPYLYDLRLAVTPTVGEGEELSQRFGFRELWCDGPDFVLNGHRVHLLGSSWWPPNPPYSDDRVRETLLALKAANTPVFRTHTQPWPENWYTIADEVGVLMIPEGAVWNDDGVYRLDDPRFWDNYRAHLLAMVRWLGNHPSVVMWSLENELTGPRINDDTPEREAALAALADDVRAADPTRPVTYESDGDPGGKADVIGLHYPHEWPRVHDWPNCADWLPGPPANAAGGGGFFWDDDPFRWTKQKPLYIGEFLWIPSNNPDWSTIFLGDRAYNDYHRARIEAKAISWSMQTKAYRRADVSGMCPWTVVEGGALDESNPLWLAHRDAYRPQAAFVREYDARFYTGDALQRTLDVYNDTLVPAAYTLRVAFERPAGGALGEPVVRALPQMEPGEHRIETVELVAPPPGEAVLKVTLDVGGRQVFEDRLAVRAYAREELPPVEVGLYDPHGTAAGLVAAGLKVRPLPSLEGELPRVVLVAPDALAETAEEANAVPVIGGAGRLGERLTRFVADGGRLLLFSQSRLPAGTLGLSTSKRGSTMAFPTMPSHPALAGIGEEDLKFWRGDHVVTAWEAPRPATGGSLPLAVTGSGAGLALSPLLELRRGAGTAIYCGLLVPQKVDSEPVAARLLANLVRYLDGYAAAVQPTSLYCRDEAAAQMLAGVGLKAKLAGEGPLAEGCGVAVVYDPPDLDAWAGRLRRFVEDGGTLLLSNVRPEAATGLDELGLAGLQLAPTAAPISRLEHPPTILGEALVREDLYWLGPQTGVISWATRPRAIDQALAVVAPRVEPDRGQRYECEAMTVEGAVVRVEPTYVLLASTGTISGSITVPTAGTYVIGVTGWGSPVAGVFPLVAVRVAGRQVGEAYLASREPGSYGLAADLPAGELPIELRFVNDANTATEDRNAMVDSVTVTPATTIEGLIPLTAPGAVVARRLGRGLVVLDEIRWTAAGENTPRARRYLAALLTALGATFRSAPETIIEGENCRIQPGLQYSGPREDHMAMVQACWAETDLDVVTAGDYVLTVICRGQPARDEWPHVTITLDDVPVGEVVADSPGWNAHRLTIALPAGRHTLRLTYDNDLYDPPDDRNFFLDKLLISPLEAQED